MEASLQAAAADAADASGPSANVWSASSLLPRRPLTPVADFAAPDVADERSWRCVRLDLKGAAGVSFLQTRGVSVTGNAPVEEGGRRARVSIPLRLSETQQHTLSLLAVAERLGGMARGEAAHGTIYEVIIHPAINAFAYISPRLIFMLAREILVILFQWILKWMVLDAVLLPASAGMQPSSVGAGSGAAPWMGRAWASINDLTSMGGGIQAAATAALALNGAALRAGGLNASALGGAGRGAGAGGGAVAGDGSAGGAGGGTGGGTAGGGGDGAGGGVGGGGENGSKPLAAGFGPKGMVGIAAETVWPDPSVHWGPHPNHNGYPLPPASQAESLAGHRRTGPADPSLLQASGGRGGRARDSPAAGQSEAGSSDAAASLPASGGPPRGAGAGAASLLQAGAGAKAGSLPGRLIRSALSMTGLAGRLAADSTAAVSAMLTPHVRERLRTRLLPVLTRTISRRVVEAAVPRATARASVLLVREVTRQLLGSQRLRSKIVSRLSANLLPRLTQGLTASVAEATTRDPTWDHVCFLCQQKQLYCGQCEEGKRHSREVAWRSAYLGRYFAAYHMGVWAKLVGW